MCIKHDGLPYFSLNKQCLIHMVENADIKKKSNLCFILGYETMVGIEIQAL